MYAGDKTGRVCRAVLEGDKRNAEKLGLELAEKITEGN